MIAKPFDESRPPSDRMGRAGWEAERQMAFYLHRAFAARPDVVVINGLRCRVHGASAYSERDCFQIDHLVVYAGGFVIVESKSARDSMTLMVDGQWMRNFNGRSTGMASPIEQGRQQGKALRELLEAHKLELKGKALLGLIQKGFQNAHLQVMVAICDGAVLNRPKGKEFPEAMKADQVCSAIDALVKEHAKAQSLFAKEDPNKPHLYWNLKDDELSRTVTFLLNRDAELRKAAVPAPEIAEPKREAPAAKARVEVPVAAVPVAGRSVKIDPLVCVKCGEEKKLEVVFRRDHCILCRVCEKYTALGRECGVCRSKTAVVIHVGDVECSRRCEAKRGGCGSEVVFWRNAVG